MASVIDNIPVSLNGIPVGTAKIEEDNSVEIVFENASVIGQLIRDDIEIGQKRILDVKVLKPSVGNL